MTIKKAIRLAEQILPGVPAPEGAKDPRWQRIITIGMYVDTAQATPETTRSVFPAVLPPLRYAYENDVASWWVYR